jgi:hypothetical protein
MPMDHRVGLDQSKRIPPPTPGHRKPDPENSIDRLPSRSLGVSGHNQKLVSQGRVLEQQISSRFQDACSEANHEAKPANHTVEASRKSCGGPAIYWWMELLPTTPTQFQIFDLNVIKDWSASDVAKSLGVGLATVYLTKHRVAAAIKKEAARLKKAAERPRALG